MYYLHSQRSIFTIIIILISSAYHVYTQPETIWMKTYGGSLTDGGDCVQQTTDGGYIIVGTTFSYGAGEGDFWLIKTDSKGDTLWTKTFGGSEWDFAGNVEQTSDSGYVIIGSKDEVYNILNLNYIHGDGWLIKTDAQGDTVWTKSFGGSDRDIGTCVQKTTDGGYIITGYTYGAGLEDVWLIKTDSNGNSLWTKTYGGERKDIGRSVQQTIDGGYVIAGYTSSYGAGSDDFWLIKTDSAGDTLWTKTFGEMNRDYSASIKQTIDKGYIIIGTTFSYGAGEGDFWLIKTDAQGDTLWTKTFGGSLGDYGSAVQQTTDGGYIIVGTTSSYGVGGNADVWLIKTDSKGDTLWTRTFGGSLGDIGDALQQTTDGGYIIVGTTSHGVGGNADVWLIKTDSKGEVSIENYAAVKSTLFSLSQNYPNPFNSKTNIIFDLHEATIVRVDIYNIFGQRIRTLLNGEKGSGSYSVIWDGRTDIDTQAPSGVYVYRLSCGKFRKSKKLLLLK